MPSSASAYQYNSWNFRNKTHCDIKTDKPQSMQGVKSNTASVRVVNWIGKKMIKINQHRSDHDEVGEPPAFPKEKASNYGWNYKV